MEVRGTINWRTAGQGVGDFLALLLDMRDHDFTVTK